MYRNRRIPKYANAYFLIYANPSLPIYRFASLCVEDRDIISYAADRAIGKMLQPECH